MDELSKEEKLRLLRESIQKSLPSEETKPDITTALNDKYEELKRVFSQPKNGDPITNPTPVFTTSDSYEKFKEAFRKRFK